MAMNSLFAFMMDFFIQYLCVFKRKLFVYKTVCCAFKESILNNPYRKIYSRAHRDNSYQYDILPHFLLTILIHKLFALEMHHTHTDKSSQTDEDGVDEIKIECTEEINQIARCQSVTGCTQRRHQRRSNGDTRNHIPFFFGGKRRYSRKATH